MVIEEHPTDQNQKGVSWYLRAAMLGRTTPHAQCLSSAKCCERWFLGRARWSAVEARKWFKLAAAQGHEEAKEQATALVARIIKCTASETSTTKGIFSGAIERDLWHRRSRSREVDSSLLPRKFSELDDESMSKLLRHILFLRSSRDGFQRDNFREAIQ